MPASMTFDPEAARRPLTVLFCDLVDSCQLTAMLDLEHIRDLLRSYQDAAAAVIDRHGGFIAKYLGDGVLAYFGYPAAREDDAECAVRAGLALLEAVAALDAGLALQLRVSIATGAVIVDQAIGAGAAREIPVFGSTPNLAARLLSITPPGSLVVDERTRHLLGGLFEFDFLGEAQLKGFPAPVPAWRALRPRESRSRFAARLDPARLTQCIGRDAEIALLLARVERAVAEGLQVVVVTGDPGIGKSRLLHEVCERIRSTGGTVLNGDCTPGSQGAPFMVLTDALRRAFGLGLMASEAEALPRIRRALKTLGVESDENAALFLNLLGLGRSDSLLQGTDPVVLRGRTEALLARLLEAACVRAPAVLVLEDIHWIDPLSQEFLRKFIEAHADLPLLLLMSSRLAGSSGWEPPNRSAVVALAPLSASGMEQLVVQRWDGVPRDIIQTVVQRSEGNPLFAEELLSLFLDRDARPADLDAGRVRQSEIPDTVAHITISRLDRLGAEPRRLLGIAAAVGLNFSPDLVAAVASLPAGEVKGMLETDTEGIVHPVQSDGAEFAFKHRLVHEAVLASLLASHQRLLHKRIAAALERSCADRPQAHAEALAHHFAAAGDAGKAVEYLLISADKRLAIYALEEAEQFLKSASDLVDQPGSPARTRLAEIVVRRMRILELTGAFGRITDMAKRYLPEIEARGNSVELCLVLGSYAHALLHWHDFAGADRIARRGLALAEELGALAAAAYAKLVQMKVLSACDDGRRFSEVARLGREIIEASEQVRDSYLACAARFQLAIHHLHDGELAPAHRAALELAEQGRLYDDARARSFAHWLMGWIGAQDRQFAAAMQHAELSLSSAVTEADRQVGLGLKGTVLALTGQPAEGLALLLATRSAAAAQQDMNLATALDAPIGVALMMTGKIRAGIRWIEAATRQREQDGYVALTYYGRLVLGEIYVSLLARKGRSARTSVRVSVRDLLFLLRVLPIARRRAERYLREAACNPRWRETSAAQARIQISLGVIAHRSGDADAARALLSRARDTARAGGYTGLERKAAALLEAVPLTAKSGRTAFRLTATGVNGRP
ncbi:MAG TPA: AAA family ATPase [Acetobacteraceae bacterium]|nr:AAA family ATPase [Acetobacteraceae bacterium]